MPSSLPGQPTTLAEILIAEQAHSGILIDVGSIELTLPTRTERNVREAFLRELLLGQASLLSMSEAHVNVASTLIVKGAWIHGDFDLSRCGTPQAPLPRLCFVSCAFTGGIRLDVAYLGGLELQDCLVLGSGINARGAHVNDALEVADCRLEDLAMIDLSEVRIGDYCRLLRIVTGVQSNALRGLLAPDALPASESLLTDPRSGIDPSHGDHHSGLRQLSIRLAQIGGYLEVSGISVTAVDTVALDAEGASVRGFAEIGKECSIGGQIKFAGANIGDQFSISGTKVCLSAKQRDDGDYKALYADGLIAKGMVWFQDSVFNGTVGLSDANIGGQLSFEDVGIAIEGPNETAISAEGARVAADFFISETKRCPPEGKATPRIIGCVNLKGCQLGGQFDIRGISIAAIGNGHALDASDSVIRGTVHIKPSESSRSEIEGLVTFDRASIGGNLLIQGAWLVASKRDEKTDGFAFKADGTEVTGNLGFSPSDKFHSKIDGTVSLLGARIDGRLLVRGTTITALHESGDSIRASGAQVKGGIYIKPWDNMPSELIGTLRLNQSTIGSKLHITDTKISAGSSGLAIVAKNATFRGDFLLLCERGTGCAISGEIRLQGMHVLGQMRAENLSAEGSRITGVAIDCYMAEISNGVQIITRSIHDSVGLSRTRNCSRLVGIVSFAHSKLGSLTIGAPRRISSAETAFFIEGNLRLSYAKVEGSTSLRGIEITPPTFLNEPVKGMSLEALREWGLTEERTCLGAEYTDFGSRLLVKLSNKSAGTIELYGAKVGTLEDNDAKGWGQSPTGDAWENPMGREATSLTGVRLMLSGFIYERLHDQADQDSRGDEQEKHLVEHLRALLFLGYDHPEVKKRMVWLRKQYPNGKISPRAFSPQPYIQLSKAYRDDGYFHKANQVSIRRRYRELRHGGNGFMHQQIQKLFGILFGFGFSPSRALATMSLLLSLSCCFSYSAFRGGLLRIPFHSEQNASLGDPRCGGYIIYAVQQVIPIGHFMAGAGCQLLVDAPWTYRLIRAIVVLLGWICLPTAILTFSGVFREKDN